MQSQSPQPDKISEPRKAHFPPVWQAGLAAIAGCAIGLSLSGSFKTDYRLTPAAEPGKKSVQAPQTPAEQKSQSPLDILNLAPSIDRRTNILLMGVDSNGRDTERFKGCRSDTMILCSVVPGDVDPADSNKRLPPKVNMVSIPRDSRVRIAENNHIEKINSAHAYGGPDLAVKTVSEDFGVPIDHYVVIDVQGLKKVFETLGPVEIMVEKNMHYRDRAARLNIALTPGLTRLNAAQVEEYVRFRHDPKGDIGRIERQQWFLRQVKKKFEEPEVLLKLPQLAKLANDYVRTDLSMTDMLKLAAVARNIKPNQIQTAMLPGTASTISGGSYWLPDAETSALILHRLTGAPLAVDIIAANTGAAIAYRSNRSSNTIADAPVDSAHAAELADDIDTPALNGNDRLNTDWAKSAANKEISVIIRYPRGQETQARNLEGRLNAIGIKVKYLQKGESNECAHEQIIATSYRADESLAARVKHDMAELEPYPITIALDVHAPSDMIVVLSPDSNIEALSQSAETK